eukprot:Filipodium_phascolosomae@DN1301_c0_g1_i2.p1
MVPTDEDDDNIEDKYLRVGSVTSVSPSEERNSSNAAAIGALANTALGLAVLALPYCLHRTGLILGLILIVVLGLMCMLGSWLLGVVAIEFEKYDSHNLPTFASVASVAYPASKLLNPLISCIVFITTFGCLISYLIVVGDLANDIFPLPFVPRKWSRLAFIAGFFVLVMVPLCMWPTLRKYAHISNLLGIMGVMYVSILIIVLSIKAGLKMPPVLFGKDPISILYTVPILACALCFHQSVFPAVSKLKRRTTKDVSIISILSLGIPILLYIPVGTCGYMFFGRKCEVQLDEQL